MRKGTAKGARPLKFLTSFLIAFLLSGTPWFRFICLFTKNIDKIKGFVKYFFYKSRLYR